MLPSPTHPRGPSVTGESSFILVRQLLVVFIFCFSILGLLASPVPTGKPSTYPAWWFSRDAIARLNPTNSSPAWPTDYPTADDYAGINEGQLKNFATQAYNELQAQAPSSVWSTSQGTNLATMVTGWSTTTGDDYIGINLGQLKKVAKSFYDVLTPIGYASGYPWTGSGADDYTAANIGQVKNIFHFDLTAPKVPISLTVVLGSTQAVLSWSDPSSGISNYTVQQSADGGLTWTTIATVSGTTATATGLTLGVDYNFRIIANGSSGSSLPSLTDDAPIITLTAPSGATLVP